MNQENSCLANILKVIETLQNNIEKIDNINNSCTRSFLGTSTTLVPFNTRLVTLYRCDNTPISLSYNNADGEALTTSIFRIQKVSCNTVLVLLLEDNGDGTYSSTNTFATINLNCVCAIQCLGDTTILNI